MSIVAAFAPTGWSATANAAEIAPSFSTVPATDQPFSAANVDYTIPCASSPTTTIETFGNGPATIGAASFTTNATVRVALKANQAVTITLNGSPYYVRCTPAGFPKTSAQVTGTPQQPNGYLTNLKSYVVMFNTMGIPVWWFNDPVGPLDAKFINPTTVAWNNYRGTYLFRNLAGHLTGKIGGSPIPIDGHELRLLPNGNYLGVEYFTSHCPALADCPNLSSWGRSSAASITDNVLVELTPRGQLVWSWDLAKHIDVAAANSAWRNFYPDVFHTNSVIEDGHGGIIFSSRHLDAVYRIDKTTGAITWKLGGTLTPQSLKVIGDSINPLFSGQHFASLLPNGDLTVYDNATRATPKRPARAVRFTIDTTKMTATEDESVADSRAVTSPYEGNAEKLPGGNWVVNWAGANVISEINSQGTPQLSILMPGIIPYRVADVPVPVSTLRAGMNAMMAPLTDIPTSSIVVPTSGSTVRGRQVMLNAAGVDPVKATQATYLLSGGSFTNRVIGQSSGSIYGWIAFIDTTSIPNGTYSLQCQVMNAAGNSTLSTPVSITVAN